MIENCGAIKCVQVNLDNQCYKVYNNYNSHSASIEVEVSHLYVETKIKKIKTFILDPLKMVNLTVVRMELLYFAEKILYSLRALLSCVRQNTKRNKRRQRF
jgi:hypothetical protein